MVVNAIKGDVISFNLK
jgi:hypothetical protein